MNYYMSEIIVWVVTKNCQTMSGLKAILLQHRGLKLFDFKLSNYRQCHRKHAVFTGIERHIYIYFLLTLLFLYDYEFFLDTQMLKFFSKS